MISAPNQADGLRQVADWLDRHPEISLHNPGQIIVIDPDEMAAVARALADGATIGEVRKTIDDDSVRLSRMFGTVNVNAYASQVNICERVVVGVETVEEPDGSSPEARRVADLEAQVAAARAAVPTRTVEREVTAWECAPLLSDRAVAS